MNSIHPTATIVGDVVMGSGNVIGPNVVVFGPAVIGDGNWFGAGAVIGAAPEVRGFALPTDGVTIDGGRGVRIGDRNVFREAAQVHQGWHDVTVVGDDAYIMNQVYIAHDCRLGDGVTLASSVLLAGHVFVGDRANIGLGTAVHQRRFIGDGAMIGMSSVVTRDIPPFAKAYGNPARVASANVVGMQRAGFGEGDVVALAAVYESSDSITALGSFAASPQLEPAMTRWRSRPSARAEA